MTYTKKIWQSGDIISANDLNNIEEGIPEIFIIEFTYNTNGFGIISTNYNTLKKAVMNKKIIIGKYRDPYGNQSFTFFDKIVINDDETFQINENTYDKNGNDITGEHFR